MSNYQRSYEILWDARKAPTPEHPNGCTVAPGGDLGPCWECMHCHDEAFKIEARLDAEAVEQKGTRR
jgi:hypothetical protein